MSTEVDPTKAKQAYAAWNDYILDQSFTIGIATTSRVHGVHYDLAYILDGTEAWLGRSPAVSASWNLVRCQHMRLFRRLRNRCWHAKENMTACTAAPTAF